MHVQVSDGEVRINGRRINLDCPCHNQPRRGFWQWCSSHPDAAIGGALVLGLLAGVVLAFVLTYPTVPSRCAPPNDGARIILGERPCIEW
jgi:hypothetical protein